MGPWPAVSVVESALRGTRAVYRASQGPFAGLRSSTPWVYAAIPGPDRVGTAVCLRCEATLPLAAPARSRARWVLIQLEGFRRRHEDCPARK